MEIDHKIILNTLLSQHEFVSSTTISEYTGIPERTVKYYVSQINSFFPNVLEINKKGVKIIDNRRTEVKTILTSENADNYYNFNDRKVFLLNRTLQHNNQISIKEVLDTFFITKNTLLNEISIINKELSKFNATFSVKDDYIYLKISPLKKRELLLHLMENELSKASFDLKIIQNYIQDIDVTSLQNFILSVIKEENIYVDDYTMANYMIHLSVLIHFNKNNSCSSVQNNDAYINLNLSERKSNIINKIYSHLKELYPSSSFNKQDIYNVSILLFNRAAPDEFDTMSEIEIESLLGERTIKILDEIKSSVFNTYSLDLNSDNFILRFGLHIKNLLDRCQNNSFISNNTFKDIKKEFPFIFAIAVHVTSIINKYVPNNLPETEISLIALYIGIISEEKKFNSKILHCILIAPNHYALRKAFIETIENNFNNNISIDLVTNNLIDDTVDKSKIDIIISSVQTDMVSSIPILFVNPIISHADIKHIQTYIDNISYLKAQNIIRNQILELFKEELFFTNTNFNSKNQTIDFMCDKMFEKNFVDSTFKQQIYEHEKICSSSYANIAITHPLADTSSKSCIALLIQKNSIVWDYSNVKIVLVFTLKDADKDLFSDIFNLIIKLINNPNIFKKLLDTTTFDEFIKLILENT